MGLERYVIGPLTALLFAAGGCATLSRADFNVINNHQLSLRSEIQDSNNYLEELKLNEYIIPNNVFEIYAQTIDPRVKDGWNNPVGGYNLQNFLDTSEEINEFIEGLEKIGLSDKEISVYSTIFSTPGNIIFKQQILENGSIKWVLPHERFHAEFAKLPESTQLAMLGTAKEMLKTSYSIDKAEIVNEWFSDEEIEYLKSRTKIVYKLMEENEEKNGKKYTSEEKELYFTQRAKLVLGRKPGREFVPSHYHLLASKNPKEFFPYLADGKFEPRVEDYLRDNHPFVYGLFDDIRRKSRLTTWISE